MRFVSANRPMLRRCVTSLGAAVLLILGGGCVSWDPLFRVAAWVRGVWPFG
ncbi:MAG: hypothetical protein AAF710_03245 [Planctomycetota bacterium]